MNGKEHKVIGKAAGALVAVSLANENDTFWDLVLRAVGGYVGGNVGQALPDFLEPAIHSFHRDVAHSIAFGVGVVELTRRLIDAWDVSHLAADATTPRGIPMLTRGF